jgi:hypothetical protein
MEARCGLQANSEKGQSSGSRCQNGKGKFHTISCRYYFHTDLFTQLLCYFPWLVSKLSMVMPKCVSIATFGFGLIASIIFLHL